MCRFLIVSIAAVLLAGAGCGSDQTAAPQWTMAFSRMPDEVRDAVHRDYPKAAIQSHGVIRQVSGTDFHYHVRLTTTSGESVATEYDATGKRVSATAQATKNGPTVAHVE